MRAKPRVTSVSALCVGKALSVKHQNDRDWIARRALKRSRRLHRITKTGEAMKAEQLTDVLVKQLGARKDGQAYVVPDTSDATIFVALTGETLAISRVTRVEISDGLLLADTHKGE